MRKILICLVFVLLFVGIAHSQTKSVIGKVVYQSTGASGNFHIIEIQAGNKRYEVYLFRKDLPEPKIIGTVDEVGRTVQVFYTKIVKSQGVDGELRATKIVEVKKSKSKRK